MEQKAPIDPYGKYLSTLNARGQFNGNALIAENGKVVYQGSFGIRSIDPLDSLDLNSKFRLASVSKQFTAMAIMILKEEGKLTYDQDIRDFLPELAYEGITVRHLLNHVSGLPDYTWTMYDQWRPDLKHGDPAKDISGNADVMAVLARVKPEVRSKPGEKWEYSNTGYNLLGTIIERASGVPFAQYLQEHIFKPAGMTRTVAYDYVRGNDPRMPDRAYGFRMAMNGTDRISTDHHYLNRAMGEDGVYSTVGDLFLWDRALYTEELVSKPTLEEALTPAILNNGDTTEYGFGWFIARSTAGKKVVLHSGGWAGFHTYIQRRIEEDQLIVVLTNDSTPYLWEVVEGLTNILKEQPFQLPKLSLSAAMGPIILNEGVDRAVEHYRRFKTERPDDFRESESDMNLLGYQLLWAGHVPEAVTIQRLNVEEYPASANAHDSYGDVLLAAGDTSAALDSFRKSWALDTAFTATKGKIDQLEAIAKVKRP